MKARYPNQSRVATDLIPWVALGVLVALVILRGTDVAPYVRSLAVSLMTPPSAATELKYLSKDALIERLIESEQALKHVSYQGALYELLLNENEGLRAELGASPNQSGTVARVIARSPRTHYGTLILDRGTAEGISVGDLVVTESVALGKIVSVSNSVSLAELFSSPGRTQDVLLGEPLAVAVSTGVGGGAFETQVPQGVAIEKGDTVRVPASETLLLGVVVSVESVPTDISKTVRFASPLSISAIDFVRVIPGTPAL